MGERIRRMTAREVEALLQTYGFQLVSNGAATASRVAVDFPYRSLFPHIGLANYRWGRCETY